MANLRLYAAFATASLTVVILAGCEEKKAPAQPPSAAAPAGTQTGQPAALAQPPADPAQLAAQGEKLYIALGCNACHSTDGTMRMGPTLAELYGAQVTLGDGTTVTVDDAYLRASILEPTQQVRKGFVPTMPSYKGRVTDPEVDALVAWLKTLK
ncbi:MAG: cytochrome c [Myxococcaceae bacterium]